MADNAKLKRAAVAKWQAIVDGIGVDAGADNCSFCDEYNRYWMGCSSCPIDGIGSRHGCGDTPYSEWRLLVKACGLADEPVRISDFPNEHKAEAMKHAVAELEFLKGLDVGDDVRCFEWRGKYYTAIVKFCGDECISRIESDGGGRVVTVPRRSFYETAPNAHPITEAEFDAKAAEFRESAEWAAEREANADLHRRLKEWKTIYRADPTQTCTKCGFKGVYCPRCGNKE